MNRYLHRTINGEDKCGRCGDYLVPNTSTRAGWTHEHTNQETCDPALVKIHGVSRAQQAQKLQDEVSQPQTVKNQTLTPSGDITWMYQLGFTDTILERLNRQLLRMPNGCLVWTGWRHHFGHGWIYRGGRGTSHEATHRVAWMLTHGPIPDGLWVLHHCDNPPCCEPTHLHLGDAADNTADMMSRGRANPPRGPRNARYRITDEQIRQIRADYETLGSYTKVARKHRIDVTYARNIVLRLSRADA